MALVTSRSRPSTGSLSLEALRFRTKEGTATASTLPPTPMAPAISSMLQLLHMRGAVLAQSRRRTKAGRRPRPKPGRRMPSNRAVGLLELVVDVDFGRHLELAVGDLTDARE